VKSSLVPPTPDPPVTLGLGGDVILAEVISAIMDVTGITDVIINAPTENQPIAEREKAQTKSSIIVIG